MKKKRILIVVGESTGACQKSIVSGEGRVSVLDKEGDCGGTCPFRYPVVTKKVYSE